jgi:spore germination cell wall hydrolase CwlJ-like protein
MKARADWRALTSAALIGSGVGVGLGAAYLAGGMARAATDHQRAERLAQAAEGGFSEAALLREAADMDPGALRVARRHDPFTVAGSAERDRQTAILASRLEQHAQLSAQAVNLRGAFNVSYPRAASPFQLAGAIDSSRELDCLTQAVYFEARGEGAAGQAAVAQVVLNRVRHPAFPKSVCAVVFQGAAHRTGCQFSFACDGSLHRNREGAAWGQAQQIAARALSGFVMAGVGDATHFHAATVAPTWGPRLLRVAQVGMHVFYRFGRGAGQSVYVADSRAGRGPSSDAVDYAESARPNPAADSSSIDFRLTSAVLMDKLPETSKAGAAQAASEPATTQTEAVKPAADKPAAKGPDAAKLTAASAPRAPEGAARSAS